MIPTRILPDLTTESAGRLFVAGAPVVEAGRSGMTGARGTIVRRELTGTDDGLRVWWSTVCPSMVTSLTYGTSLDLSDPAGMDLAARWLARHHGLTAGATAPRFYRQEENGIAVWFLDTGTKAIMFWTPLERCYLRESVYVHAGKAIGLDGISALTDPAEALALACLAAGGRS